MKSYIVWDVTPCSRLKVNVSQEYVISIFRAEESAEQETRELC
jgi:hypothetical protein